MSASATIDSLERTVQKTLATIKQHVPTDLCNPQVGIVCGSGLSTLAAGVRDAVEVPYQKLEGFASSTGESWKSNKNICFRMLFF